MSDAPEEPQDAEPAPVVVTHEWPEPNSLELQGEGPLTKEAAQELHDDLRQIGLVIWCVTENPSDMPGKCVSRPSLIPSGDKAALLRLSVHHLRFRPDALVSARYLVADTLAELRAMRPNGSWTLNRAPEDDPVIVETWIG